MTDDEELEEANYFEQLRAILFSNCREMVGVPTIEWMIEKQNGDVEEGS